MNDIHKQKLVESVSHVLGRSTEIADLLRQAGEGRGHGEIRSAVASLMRLADQLNVTPQPARYGGFTQMQDNAPVVTAKIIGRTGKMIRVSHQCMCCNTPEEYLIEDNPEAGPIFVENPDCINDRSFYIETGIWLRVPDSEWNRFSNWERSKVTNER